MWPILLKILSIIGIVLGCIIGLLVVLIIIILVSPVTYKLDAAAHSEKYTAKLKIKYIFGLVRAGYGYPDPGYLYVKILWFTIFSTKKEEVKSYEVKEDTNIDENNIESSIDIKQDIANDYTDVASENKKVIANKPNENDSIKNKSNKSDSKKKKFKNPIYLLKKKYIEVKNTITSLYKLRKKDYNFYKKLIEDDSTKKLLSSIKKAIFKLFKILAPKKGVGNITLGMDSPDTTAYIYGIYCVVLNKLRDKIIIEPDFDNKIIDGYLRITGIFNLFSIIVIVLPIVFGRKLKLLRARLDKHSENIEIAKRKYNKTKEKELNNLNAEYM